MRVEEALQIDALESFHHEVARPARGPSVIVQADDVRVPNAAEEANLVLEAFEPSRVRRAANQLDRDRFSPAHVFCFVDDAHAAFTDSPLDAIRSEPQLSERFGARR